MENNNSPKKSSRFYKQTSLRKKLPIYGDGQSVREWIHVSDQVKGIQTVLEKRNPGEIYNIGTISPLSNDALASEIIKVMVSDERMKSYVSDRQGHDFRYSVDSEKIESLGFKREIDFKDGLEETVKWYMNNTDWWS
jgi:dTDP-glucose 4,6-dehydratase